MEPTNRYDERDDETGQFTRQHEPREFVKAVNILDLATTADVADRVGCSHRTALKTLNELEEEGRVESHMAGRAAVWSLPDS